MLSRHRKDFPEMVENGDRENIDEEGGVEEEDENAQQDCKMDDDDAEDCEGDRGDVMRMIV